MVNLDKETLEKIALMLQDKSDLLRKDLKEDIEFMGKNYDPNSYGSGFDKGYLSAIEDISRDVLMMSNSGDDTC